MSDNLVSEVNITSIKGRNKTYVMDLTAREIELTVLLNGYKIVSLNCSPGNYEYLTIGFLYTNGILLDTKNIVSIKTGKDEVKIIIKNIEKLIEKLKKPHLPINIFDLTKLKKIKKTNCSKISNIKLSVIYNLLAKMQEKAYFFNITGGVHSCGMADKEGSLLLFCEDVSRYNTIDRIFGEALVKNIFIKDKLLLTSCRITSGILKKIINGGITCIISRSAVTDNAVKLAHKTGITLIGFAREYRMNVYSCPFNIIN